MMGSTYEKIKKEVCGQNIFFMRNCIQPKTCPKNCVPNKDTFTLAIGLCCFRPSIVASS